MDQHNARGDYLGSGEGVGLIALKLVSANTYSLGAGTDDLIATWDLTTDVSYDYGFNVSLKDGDSRLIAVPRIGWYRFAAWVQFPAANTSGTNFRQIYIQTVDASGTLIQRTANDLYYVFNNTQVYEVCTYGEYYLEDTDWAWSLGIAAQTASGLTIPVGTTLWVNYINTR